MDQVLSVKFERCWQMEDHINYQFKIIYRNGQSDVLNFSEFNLHHVVELYGVYMKPSDIKLFIS